MLYGYFENLREPALYRLIQIRPTRYINGASYHALVLGTWDSEFECDRNLPDKDGRTLSEIKDTYPTMMLCEDFYEVQICMRRFEHSTYDPDDRAHEFLTDF